MKNIKLILFGLAFLLAFNACKTEPEEKKKREFKAPEQENIETLFENDLFESDSMQFLLKEINICDEKQEDLTNLISPACHPKFFRFFSYAKNEKLEDAFLLLTKAGTHGYKLRRLYVFQREHGQLVQVNRFFANLIAKRNTKGNYDDLVLRFTDGEDNFFNCLYSWNRDKYEFRKVEEINESRVKAQFQDSMNVEIHKMIMDNGMEL
jgi:hypothetical protein